MKRNFIYIAALVLILSMGCFFFYGKSGEDKRETGKEKENIKISADVRPISEVSKTAQTDYERAKTKSRKLTFDNITPYCPDLESVSDIFYTLPKKGTYKGITDEKDMLEEQLKFMEDMLGKSVEELNPEGFESGYYNLMDRNGYQSFEEFLHDDEVNKKREPRYLSYVEQDETYLKDVTVTENFYRIVFERGRVYELNYENRMEDEHGNTTSIMLNKSQRVAEYYAYENDGRLDDRWKLEDGELSVREGIAFTEKYLDKLFQIDGANQDITHKVCYVYVYDLGNGIYTFQYNIRRCIKGVLIPTWNPDAGMAQLNLDTDSIEGGQVQTKTLDSYMGRTKMCYCEVKNTYTSMLPLGKAIEILEAKLGNNSEYRVQAIELGYLPTGVSPDNYGGVTTLNLDGGVDATVCWYFRCKNEQDNVITEFFVNVETGELKIYAGDV